MFLSLFFSCFSLKEIPKAPRVDIHLEQEWNQKPWELPLSTFPQKKLSANISLDDEFDIRGSTFILSGLWWEGTLSINNNPLPTFYGGNQQVEISLGTLLQANQSNQLSLIIQPPTHHSTMITGGSFTSHKQDASLLSLEFPPILSLRPKTHISGMSLPVQDGFVTPLVWVSGDQATEVELFVVLDGKIQQHLGSCPIANGISQCSSASWDLNFWNLDAPHLYHLVGRLKDSTGSILDQNNELIGVRELQWDENGIKINNELKRFMSIRIPHLHGKKDFAEGMKLYSQGGVNSIEIHGDLIRQDWLQDADELGLPVVILPRCVGQVNQRDNLPTNELLPFMRLQDQRLLWDIKTHPSLTAITLEGNTSTKWNYRALWTEYLQKNEHNIPVFGLDLPAKLLKLSYQGTALQSECLPENCESSWLVETVVDGPFPQWAVLSQKYLSTHQEGAIGGVIPTPRENSNQEQQQTWIESWKDVANQLNVPTLSGTSRASTEITIQTKSKEYVEVWADYLTPQRKQANRQGLVSFSLYHQGRIFIRCEEKEHSVKIKADQWKNFTHIHNNSTIYCQ